MRQRAGNEKDRDEMIWEDEVMNKMRMGVVILVCILLTGCQNGSKDAEGKRNVENTAADEREGTEEAGAVTTAEADNTEKESATQQELVSVAEFVEYYGMEEGAVPSDYLEGFIGHRQLTRDSLSERNYDAMVKELYERGVTFGSTAAELIAGERAELSEEDDFSDVAYVVLQKDVYVDGSDMAEPQVVVLEVENRKVYATEKNVTDDYTAAENVKELSEADVRECLLELRAIITEDWKQYHGIEKKEYGWKLHIVKEDGAVISFSGEGPDEEYHPGFAQWCEDYLE